MRALLLAGALALALFCVSAAARDDGRYAQSPLREWFNSLTNQLGHNCCSMADGSRVEDVDWEVTRRADGTLGYRVRLYGHWIEVPDERLVTVPNRIGPAIVWPYDDDGIKIRCFMPGAGA